VASVENEELSEPEKSSVSGAKLVCSKADSMSCCVFDRELLTLYFLAFFI